MKEVLRETPNDKIQALLRPIRYGVILIGLILISVIMLAKLDRLENPMLETNNLHGSIPILRSSQCPKYVLQMEDVRRVPKGCESVIMLIANSGKYDEAFEDLDLPATIKLRVADHDKIRLRRLFDTNILRNSRNTVLHVNLHTGKKHYATAADLPIFAELLREGRLPTYATSSQISTVNITKALKDPEAIPGEINNEWMRRITTTEHSPISYLFLTLYRTACAPCDAFFKETSEQMVRMVSSPDNIVSFAKINVDTNDIEAPLTDFAVVPSSYLYNSYKKEYVPFTYDPKQPIGPQLSGFLQVNIQEKLEL